MQYKVLHVREEDFIIFKQLKHRLQLDSDLDAFHDLIESRKKILNDINEKTEESGRVAG